MKIIGGMARGRKLKTLEGESTRPTAGKVRAALFNILNAWIPDAEWLDLYAGSGAVGLEAVSRGAARAMLVERAGPALQVVYQNVDTLDLAGVEVLALDVLVALPRLAGQQFDVIFLDPPYAEDPGPALTLIAQHDLLKADGRLVLEHHADRVAKLMVGEKYRWLRTARYSENSLSFYGTTPAS
ncbi:MAG: putative methylase [Cyanobacteria bacterium RYN_339]|nr:putative methylase [Cyanobacteria bacterium RYN_339]